MVQELSLRSHLRHSRCLTPVLSSVECAPPSTCVRSFFFLRERDGKSSQKVNLDAAQCAPQASQNKLTASGVLSVSSSNSVQRPGSCQQRRGECSCAGYGDHARPSSSSMPRRLASPVWVAPPALDRWPAFQRTGLLRNSTCPPFPGPRQQGGTDRQPTTQCILSPCLPWLFRKRARPLGQIPASALRCLVRDP